jgi:hypothetical protein
MAQSVKWLATRWVTEYTFSSPVHSDQLWRPVNLLSGGYQTTFPGWKAKIAWIWPFILYWCRNYEWTKLPPPPIRLYYMILKHWENLCNICKINAIRTDNLHISGKRMFCSFSWEGGPVKIIRLHEGVLLPGEYFQSLYWDCCNFGWIGWTKINPKCTYRWPNYIII